MKLEHSFQVAAPLDRVWEALIDVERVAPCLPGAEITEAGEGGTYRGTFSVRLGPTTAAYRGELAMAEVDATGLMAATRAFRDRVPGLTLTHLLVKGAARCLRAGGLALDRVAPARAGWSVARLAPWAPETVDATVADKVLPALVD